MPASGDGDSGEIDRPAEEGGLRRDLGRRCRPGDDGDSDRRIRRWEAGCRVDQMMPGLPVADPAGAIAPGGGEAASRELERDLIGDADGPGATSNGESPPALTRQARRPRRSATRSAAYPLPIPPRSAGSRVELDGESLDEDSAATSWRSRDGLHDRIRLDGVEGAIVSGRRGRRARSGRSVRPSSHGRGASPTTRTRSGLAPVSLPSR